MVPARALRPGERVAVAGGTAVVLGLEERGDEPVYTLEVDGDHCYRVGEQGILVHNASAVGPVPITLNASERANIGDVGRFRMSLGLPAAGSAADESTVVKLVIAGRTIWGINWSTGGHKRDTLDYYNQEAMCCNPSGTGAFPVAIGHAEADAIFQAFDKRITADTGVMYCDRKLCNFCKQSIANLLCLARLRVLTWIGPSDSNIGFVRWTFYRPTRMRP